MVRKLQYAPNLYVGEGIYAGKGRMNTEKLDKLKKKLAKKPLLANAFVIALARNPENQLEIYDAKQLVQSYYVKYPPYIVGLALDYREALSLLEQIVRDCLQERGDCRLKEFLLC